MVFRHRLNYQIYEIRERYRAKSDRFSDQRYDMNRIKSCIIEIIGCTKRRLIINTCFDDIALDIFSRPCSVEKEMSNTVMLPF